MFDLDELHELRARIHAQVQSNRACSMTCWTLFGRSGRRSGRSGLAPPPAVAVMAADGGNNMVAFNPFYLQIVRVVDSKGRQLCLDVLSPSTDTAVLTARQFAADDEPLTALAG